MIGKLFILGRKGKDEGEKPFWISFADLMSALMVLFLLVMSVALLAVTSNVTESERKQAQRKQEIDKLLDKIEQATKQFPGVSLDRNRNVIDFGDKARFDTGSSELTSEQAEYLTLFVLEILPIAGDDLGKIWLKSIVSEGFADQRGDYLLNLNLSMQRSERVLCILLSPPPDIGRVLDAAEREQAHDLFFVGGYSFNSVKKTLEESRRIELRLDFFGVDEIHPEDEEFPHDTFGKCRI
jgi:outer membrane protein OmpA-like peptidoglycan-associated protein